MTQPAEKADRCQVSAERMDPGADLDEPRVLNINVGVLGHVDSGKTSLVAALSSTLSTAALDKHPQSRARGITLDLGFSSFSVPLPPHLEGLPYDSLQLTLVDCPGHASLIKTIIGGARIIDMMVLVVDITKGLQAQTAECLVVGEMAAQNLVVALNKVDLLPPVDRSKAVKKAVKRLAAAFASTRFAGAPMVAVAARPGGGGVPAAAVATGGVTEAEAEAVGAAGGGGGGAPEGIDELRAALVSMAAPRPPAPAAAPLLFAVDHCFAVRGQGTVLTGTVLQGQVGVGDSVELPALKLTRQVKSIQMFRRPARSAAQGDRAALLVTQLDPKLLERGLAAAPGSVPTFSGAVAAVEKVRFYEGPVPGRVKYHVCVGHDTVMAEATFFGLPDGCGGTQDDALCQMIEALEAMSLHQPAGSGFDWGREYRWQDQLYGLEGRPLDASAVPLVAKQQQQQQQGDGDGGDVHYGPQWAFLKFEKPLTAPADAGLIGARLDLDAHMGSCRLAFFGRLLALVDPGELSQLARLRVYKPKERVGTIDRIAPDGSYAIIRGLFKKESDVTPFIGATVETASGGVGTIAGRFGTSGKVRVDFPGGVGATTPQAAAAAAEGTAAAAAAAQRGAGGGAVVLRYKKFVFREGGGGGGDARRVQQ